LSTSRRRKPGVMKREKGRPRRFLLFLIPLVLAVAVLGYVVTQPAASVGVGSIAPDFELQVVGPNGLTGETVKLSSFRGGVVFLEFMESWCRVCQGVAPAVESIRWDYEPRGVVFISVAGTHRGANAESTAAFIREYQTHWTYVLDSDNSVFSKYNVEATPTFFILDRSGVIVNTFKGVTTTEVITSTLDAALAG
jgi:thiol-disulfide isomerase/thioredoxin